jgi:two-component system nitrogen regulation response regulator GlnG/two-component system response regulator HydG
MTSWSRTNLEDDLPWKINGRSPREVPALVILWSLDEPSRIGQAALVLGTSVLGRGGSQVEDGASRLVFAKQRPGSTKESTPLVSSRISRVQLKIEPAQDGKVTVTNVGKLALLHRGAEVKKLDAQPGDVLVLKNSLVLLVTRRTPVLEEASNLENPSFGFGEPDTYGIVGESPASWRLRDAIAFAARSPHHVLVQGPSGVGKELTARAVHGMSPRSKKELIARNAATFPSGIVDAELFGNAKGYPNAGMPERPGLIGEADGSTLFLDEIGELPTEMQAHLLRVMDRGGEYQRLGESRVRQADVRLVAATNREMDALKHDFAARLTVRTQVPGLDERVEDIPLLVRHILLRLAQEMPDVHARFFEVKDGRIEPRIEPALIDALVTHRYTHHLRELERLVWLAVSTSKDQYLARTKEVEAELRLPSTGEATESQIRAALETSNGNVTRAARHLGLKNRFALYRLMKQFGIAGAENEEEEKG